jgi:hypothetical protein
MRGLHPTRLLETQEKLDKLAAVEGEKKTNPNVTRPKDTTRLWAQK